MLNCCGRNLCVRFVLQCCLNTETKTWKDDDRTVRLINRLKTPPPLELTQKAAARGMRRLFVWGALRVLGKRTRARSCFSWEMITQWELLQNRTTRPGSVADFAVKNRDVGLAKLFHEVCTSVFPLTRQSAHHRAEKRGSDGSYSPQLKVQVMTPGSQKIN